MQFQRGFCGVLWKGNMPLGKPPDYWASLGATRTVHIRLREQRGSEAETSPEAAHDERGASGKCFDRVRLAQERRRVETIDAEGKPKG